MMTSSVPSGRTFTQLSSALAKPAATMAARCVCFMDQGEVFAVVVIADAPSFSPKFTSSGLQRPSLPYVMQRSLASRRKEAAFFASRGAESCSRSGQSASSAEVIQAVLQFVRSPRTSAASNVNGRNIAQGAGVVRDEPFARHAREGPVSVAMFVSFYVQIPDGTGLGERGKIGHRKV